MRRALEARDRCCIFPGCHRTARLQAHHTKWYMRDGDTVPANLGLYCWQHHRLIHDRKITVEKTDSGSDSSRRIAKQDEQVVFRDSHGKVIAREPLKAVGPKVAELNRARGVEVSAETCLPGRGGEPGDLRYVADIYLINRHVSLRESGKAPPDGPDP